MAGKFLWVRVKSFARDLGRSTTSRLQPPTGSNLPYFAESKRSYVVQIVLPCVESSGFGSRWASQGTQGGPVASSGFFDAFVTESGYEWKRELILK
jgi:hypothetical protein